jgi:hypothetical protein
MQIKNKSCDGSLLWGGMPDVVQSTALAVEFSVARLRACYNGDFYDGGSWLYGGQAVRQISAAHGWPYVFWGCFGSWFSGGWYDSGAVNYIQTSKRRSRSAPGSVTELEASRPLARALANVSAYTPRGPSERTRRAHRWPRQAARRSLPSLTRSRGSGCHARPS